MRSWLLACLVVLALAAAGVSPAMAGAAGWSLEHASNAMQPDGSLAGISCSSSTWCVAVGDYVDPSNLDAALIERWNGVGWTIVPAPNPAGTRGLRLLGVSCTSSKACVAVGNRNLGTGSFDAIAERWNGSSWTLETMPAGVSELYGVSCSSRNACTAVGGNQVVRWDGTSWTTQTLAPPPNLDPQRPVRMASVSCASATACTAVGFYFPRGGAIQPVAEHWDGTSWAVDGTPLPSGDTAGELEDVSCSSSSACTAVGQTYSGGASSTLALRWDGTSWTLQATPNSPGSGGNMLNGVSCVSATACVAVGQSGLAAHWDGTTWSLDANPQPILDQAVLTGVSCASTTSCTAVGGPGHTQPTMAEHWDGTTWTVQATPPVIGALDSKLEGVSCLLASSCVAVGGFSHYGGNSQPLAERWDGSSWTVQSIPGPAGVTLYGVSCSSSSACTAVGFTDPYPPDPRQRIATAERWNGTTWTSQPIPAPAGAQGTSLYSVSCPSASSCTAVGDSFATDGKATALVERWDGSGWTIQSAPSPVAADQSALFGVSCSSPTVCTAVGAGYKSTDPVPPFGVAVPLAERWDGQSWTIQPTLTPPGSVSSVLIGVSCPADTACTAVGWTSGSSSTAPLVERWNGAVWTLQSAPSANGTSSVLTSVSCSSTPCTATGYYDVTSGESHPLAEHWDGTAWSIQSAPEPPDLRAFLNGVSCTSDSRCQAVGYADNIDSRPVALADGYG